MTAWEMVDGKYYEQYSDEYYAALQEITERKVDVAHLIAREIKRPGSIGNYSNVPALIVRAAPSRSE